MVSKRDLQIQENRNIAFVTKNGSERVVFDVIRFSTGHTDAHDWTVFKICKELKEQGFKFATEVSFSCNGKTRRADVLDFTRGIAIEVQCSESDESIAEKKKDWGDAGFDFLSVRAWKEPQISSELLDLWEDDGVWDTC